MLWGIMKSIVFWIGLLFSSAVAVSVLFTTYAVKDEQLVIRGLIADGSYCLAVPFVCCAALIYWDKRSRAIVVLFGAVFATAATFFRVWQVATYGL